MRLLSRGPNKLFEAAARAVAQGLIGKLIQTKIDPYKAFLSGKEEEPLIALIVKVVEPEEIHQGWQFHLLIDKKLDVFWHNTMTDFFETWEVIDTRPPKNKE